LSTFQLAGRVGILQYKVICVQQSTLSVQAN